MIQEIIERIQRKIDAETACNMSKEQEQYVVGLADALQIIEEYTAEQPQIGKAYYVIVNNETPCVEQMYLYRINNKTKTTYCFSRNKQNPKPDLVLSSRQSMKSRVFNTYEEAQAGIPYFVCLQLEAKEFRWKRPKL